MSAALFDPDGIMREVRAKAYPLPPAKTANLLNDTPNFSSLAKLAGRPHIAEPAPLNTPESWSQRLYEFLSRPRPDDTSVERWACACRGVEEFAGGWAAKTMRLGWSFDGLFAFVDPFANMSLQGAAWFVGDSTITAVTADAITLRTEGGATRVKPPQELIALGERLMDQAEAAPRWSARRRAVVFRDGLLIALLAYRPVRRKNLAMMRLGRHLMKVGGRWQIAFSAEEMKTRVPYEAVLPAALASRVERYFDVHRPVLLRGKHKDNNRDAPPIDPELDAVWVSERGTQLTDEDLGFQIFVRTRREFGCGLFPHMFRDCVATAVAVDNPKHIGDASLILGHSEHRTTEKHYNHARSLNASRRYAGKHAREPQCQREKKIGN